LISNSHFTEKNKDGIKTGKMVLLNEIWLASGLKANKMSSFKKDQVENSTKNKSPE